MTSITVASKGNTGILIEGKTSLAQVLTVEFFKVVTKMVKVFLFWFRTM